MPVLDLDRRKNKYISLQVPFLARNGTAGKWLYCLFFGGFVFM